MEGIDDYLTMRNVRLILFLFLAFTHYLQAQRPAVKVGVNPASLSRSAVLEVESTTKGFLPPRMTSAQMLAIPSPPQGLMVYCTDCNPVGLRVNNGSASTVNWQSVSGGGSTGGNSVLANCNTAGFSTGPFLVGTALTGRTFSVTISNQSFATVIITFASSDIQLTGASGGLAVGTSITGVPALTSNQATLNAGQSVTVSYPITGTPTTAGTLTATWNKLTLSCVKSVTVYPTVNCTNGSWTTAITPAALAGFTSGTAYSGIFSIPFTNGSGILPPESFDFNGLTLTYAGGSLSASGNLQYQLSGTYTGTTGAGILVTTQAGCTIESKGVTITSSGFSGGDYLNGVVLNGKSYSVSITNNTSTSRSLAFASSNVALSGVSNITIGTPTPTSATLSPGQSITVNYPLSNTVPGNCGKLTGNFTNSTLSASNVVSVLPVLACGSGSWNGTLSPPVSSTLTNGQSYTGTYRIPYTGGGAGCVLSDSQTINGLTLSINNVSTSASGFLDYSLSGIYTGSTGGAVSFQVNGGRVL